MKKIFIALMVFLFSITFNVSKSVEIGGQLIQNNYRLLDILPGFIGWYLILKGVEEINEEHNVYSVRFISFVKLVFIFSIFYFFNNWLLVINWVFMRPFIAFVFTLVEVAILYVIAGGYREIKNNMAVNQAGLKIHKMLKYQVLLTVFIYLFTSYVFLALLLALIIGILRVMMLYYFYKSYKEA